MNILNLGKWFRRFHLNTFLFLAHLAISISGAEAYVQFRKA